MKLAFKRLAAVTALGAAGVLVPAATAPAAPSTAASALAAAGPGAVPAPALIFLGPQVAIGPVVIGTVFNGPTPLVVSNGPPINSGNVIVSP